MEISPVVCWLVAGLLLVGVDMLLGTFYLLVMGLAAGCGALAAWGGLSVGWQFSVFAVATIVGSLIVQRFRSAKPTESDALQQPDVGQNVTVKKWNDDGTTPGFLPRRSMDRIHRATIRAFGRRLAYCASRGHAVAD